MSKVNRIILASLISLAVIVGIYSTVESASLGAAQPNKIGTHLVSGSRVNLDHYRESAPAPASIESDFPSEKGHDCESDMHTSPDD
jgi:hypothetical protein